MTGAYDSPWDGKVFSNKLVINPPINRAISRVEVIGAKRSYGFHKREFKGPDDKENIKQSQREGN